MSALELQRQGRAPVAKPRVLQRYHTHRRASPQTASRRRVTVVMLLPWLVGFIAFILGPLLVSLVLSFTSYDVFSPPKWIGLGNFGEMLHDPYFLQSWRLTLIYGAVGTVYMLVLALATALLIYHARWASGFWRVLYYFPSLLGGASEGYIMIAVWTQNYGLVDAALHLVGIRGPGWIDSPQSALPAVILMRYWTVGTMLLLFLGARANVPAEYYEAAVVDGAGSLRLFRYITFPFMSPVVLVNLILGVVATLQAFTEVWILTGGGPENATNLIGIDIYVETFKNSRLGYGSAMSWSLFVVTLLITIVIMGTSRFWVHYEHAGDWR